MSISLIRGRKAEIALFALIWRGEGVISDHNGAIITNYRGYTLCICARGGGG